MTVAVKAPPFRAVGDGVTDDTDALQRAIDSVAELGDPDPLGPTVWLPKGRYRISRTLEIRRKVRLAGTAGGGLYTMCSHIVADPGVTAIKVVGPHQGNQYQSGQGTQIEDLVIEARGKTSKAHGISAKAFFYARNVAVLGFAGNGFHCKSDFADDEPGALSGSMVAHCRAANVDGTGLLFQGGDSNACTAIGFLAQNCTEGGIADMSFLGCNFFGFTIEACKGPGFRNQKNAPCSTRVIGGYVEGDCGLIAFYAPGWWIGEPTGAGFTPDSTGTVLGSGVQRMLFRDTANGRHYMGRVIDSNGQMYTVRTDRDLASSGFSYSGMLPGMPDGWHVYAFNNNPQYAAWAIGAQRSREGLGAMWLPHGAYLGGAGDLDGARFFTTGDGPPTIRHLRKVWRKGDTVWNVAAAGNGQPMGWKCSVSGGWPSRGNWRPGTSYECGHVIEPDPANGLIYRCEQVGSLGVGVTGDTQPAWPTNIGDRVEDGVGGTRLAWVCRGQKGPEFEPGPVW